MAGPVRCFIFVEPFLYICTFAVIEIIPSLPVFVNFTSIIAYCAPEKRVISLYPEEVFLN